MSDNEKKMVTEEKKTGTNHKSDKPTATNHKSDKSAGKSEKSGRPVQAGQKSNRSAGTSPKPNRPAGRSRKPNKPAATSPKTDTEDREERSQKSEETNTASYKKNNTIEQDENRKKRRKKMEEISEKDQKVLEESEDPWFDDDDDNILSDTADKPKRRGMKIFWITMASIIGVLAIAYIGISIFFMSHFYFNTTINHENFSTKTVADVQNYMKEQVQNYKLTIQERDNVTETIDGSDIALTYVENDDIQKAMEKQNAFLWPIALFNNKNAEVQIDVSFDEDKLAQKLQELKCISGVEQVDPVNAVPVYQNGAFVVQPETVGTKVDMDRFTEDVNEHISSFNSTLDMDKEGCYLMPKYTSESPEVQAACDKMNNYCKASITYDMSPNTEVVNKDLISSWLTCDADMNVTFNTDAVTGYMAELAGKYDTVGKSRTITTPGGKTAEVSGGTYGWPIDEATETQNLITSIQNGEVATRTPAYEQTAATHDAVDWGNTYLEVDISSQHMWYVSGGAVALETDVVTGVGNDPNKATPAGVYQVLEKLSPTILKGEIQSNGKPEYETEVTYWIRVTWSGIGFHDATWQSAFGGSLYLEGAGSHGCINMPYSVVESLYGMVSMGCPIIIHY